jgi:hypothetical protein
MWSYSRFIRLPHLIHLPSSLRQTSRRTDDGIASRPVRASFDLPKASQWFETLLWQNWNANRLRIFLTDPRDRSHSDFNLVPNAPHRFQIGIAQHLRFPFLIIWENWTVIKTIRTIGLVRSCQRNIQNTPPQ